VEMNYLIIQKAYLILKCLQGSFYKKIQVNLPTPRNTKTR